MTLMIAPEMEQDVFMDIGLNLIKLNFKIFNFKFYYVNNFQLY